MGTNVDIVSGGSIREEVYVGMGPVIASYGWKRIKMRWF